MATDGEVKSYGGTIRAEMVPDINTLVKEFYRLPLKQKNEILISVKASSEAQILLFDGDKSADASDVKVQVVLGSDKNSTVSIGLAKDDPTGAYAKELVQEENLLSSTHFKTFAIRWHYGRVMVYHHGYAKPFITWDGPKNVAFSYVGVRTVGCSGDWQVQGMADITTPDGAEYKEIQINSGRLDFDVRAQQGAIVMLTADPKTDRAASMHYVIGWTDAANSIKEVGIWANFVRVHCVDEPDFPLSMGEFKRFWCEWDANNFTYGHGGSTIPIGCWAKVKPTVNPIRYIGLQGCNVQDYVYFRILERQRDEDTAPRKPGDQDPTGDQVGYVVYNYKYTDAGTPASA